MKHILFLAFMLPFVLFGQTNYEDVVYLKNGSIIHGIIIENVPNVSIKIKNNSGDIFFYKLDEIQKITKEEPVTSPKTQAKPKEPEKEKEPQHFAFDSVRKRVIGTVEIGGIFGVSATTVIPNQGYSPPGSFKYAMFELRGIVEDMITKRFAMGIGFNLDISSTDPIIGTVSPTILLPFFIDVKYCFLKRRFSPFVAAQAGGGIYLHKTLTT